MTLMVISQSKASKAQLAFAIGVSVSMKMGHGCSAKIGRKDWGRGKGGKTLTT
jgi:hypothetical protein